MPAKDDHDVAAELRALPGFGELPSDAIGELELIASSRRVPSHARIVEQGSISTVFVLLVRGAAKTVRTTESGKGTQTMVLDVMRAPCVVADPSVFDGAAATGSVVALRACQLLVIERRALHRALLAHPSLARVLLARMAEDVRAHVRRIDEVVSGAVDERVKHLLESLAVQHGTPLGQGRFIAIPLRRKDIACMVNATTETVSRLLARFEREGLARSTRDGIWWRSSSRPTPVPSPAPPMVRENV